MDLLSVFLFPHYINLKQMMILVDDNREKDFNPAENLLNDFMCTLV